MTRLGTNWAFPSIGVPMQDMLIPRKKRKKKVAGLDTRGMGIPGGRVATVPTGGIPPTTALGTRRSMALPGGQSPLGPWVKVNQPDLKPPLPRTGAPATRSTWEPGEEGVMRRMARQGLSTEDAMWQLRLRKATEQSIARMGMTGGGVAAAPSGNAFAGLPRTLAPQTAREPLLQQMAPSGAAEQAMVEGPVSAQRHLGAGRYNRPLPGIGIGAREALEEEAELEASNRSLAEAIRGAAPAAMAGTPTTSMITGKGLGRFSPRFTGGGLPEYTEAMIAHRDALAAGEPTEYPGSFRTSPGEIDTEAARENEAVAKERRLARRKGLRSPFSQQARQRVVGARARGQFLSPEMAEIQEKIAQDETLSEDEQMMAFGLPGMMGRIKKRELEAAERGSERESITNFMATPGFAELPRSERKRWRDRLDSLSGRRGIPGGAGGGGLGAVTPPGGEGDMGPVSDIAGEMPEDIRDDPVEAERWIRSEAPDISEAAINQWGIRRYGAAAWDDRHHPVRGIPGGGIGRDIGHGIARMFPSLPGLPGRIERGIRGIFQP